MGEMPGATRTVGLRLCGECRCSRPPHFWARSGLDRANSLGSCCRIPRRGMVQQSRAARCPPSGREPASEIFRGEGKCNCGYTRGPRQIQRAEKSIYRQNKSNAEIWAPTSHRRVKAIRESTFLCNCECLLLHGCRGAALSSTRGAERGTRWQPTPSTISVVVKS